MRVPAQHGESTIWRQKVASNVLAALMLSASILPQAVQAQSVTVGSEDNDGPDDEQAQSDLTSFEIVCPGTAAPVLPLSVQLDPVANSGGNSSDISILFDTDGDGNANYSYVITLGNDPFSVIDIQLQLGRNDSSQIKISGNKTDVAIGTTTSSTSIGTNPFNGDDDTLVALDLDISAIANHAGVTLDDVQFLNVTTIPSSSATSDPKDVLLATAQAFTSDDSGSTDVDSTIAIDTLGNDSVKIDWSTAQIVSPPSNGSVTINTDGTIDYVPDGDYTGVDTFSYSAVATDCTTYTSNVTVTITGIAAVDDTATETSTDAGVANILNVYDNDTIDGTTPTPATTSLAIAPASSLPPELTFDTGTGAVGVAPGALPGTYSFDYQICRDDDPTYCRIATVTVEVLGVDLVTAKVVSSADTTPEVGDTVQFTITVTNNGVADATNVTLTDALPAGLAATANNGQVTAGSYTASTGVWTIPTLANGASATLTLEGTVVAGQGGNTITNTTTAATSDETDPGTTGDTLSASVDAIEILPVTESGSGIAGVVSTPIANVRSNDTVNGAAADATNSTIAESGTWPAGITLNTTTGAISIDATVTADSYDIVYELCDLASPANCATVTDTITVAAPQVDFVITKTNGTTEVTSGDDTTYTVVVTSNGPDPVTGAVVTDAPGAGITCSASAAVTITGDGVPAGTFTFGDLSGGGITLGTLTTGQSTTFTYTCQVN